MNAIPVSSSFVTNVVIGDGGSNLNCLTIAENSGGGTDTDSDLEESPDYYRPISATGDEDSGSDSDQANSNGGTTFRYSSNLKNYLPNGHANGVASLTINEDPEEKISEDDGNEEESAILAVQRAFMEDDSRRTAPLRPENASRVMEAMRGVSFAGSAPSWAEALPEDQWIEQLRNLRRPSVCHEGVRPIS